MGEIKISQRLFLKINNRGVIEGLSGSSDNLLLKDDVRGKVLEEVLGKESVDKLLHRPWQPQAIKFLNNVGTYATYVPFDEASGIIEIKEYDDSVEGNHTCNDNCIRRIITELDPLYIEFDKELAIKSSSSLIKDLFDVPFNMNEFLIYGEDEEKQKEFISWLGRQVEKNEGDIFRINNVFTRNGSKSFVINVLKNNSGTYFMVFEDVSVFIEQEKKHEELNKSFIEISEEFRKTENMLSLLINTTPNWIYIKSVDDRYHFVNKSFEEVLGRSSYEIVGKSDTELNIRFVSNLSLECELNSLIDSEVLNGKELFMNSHLVLPNGKIKHIKIYKFPYFDRNDCISGVINFATDITELKEVEKSLKKSNEELVKLNTCLIQTNEELSGLNQKLEDNEQELLSIIENTPDTILRYNTDLKHVFVSSNVKKIFGTTTGAMINKTVRELPVFNKNALGWDAMLNRVMDSGKLLEKEFVFLGPRNKKLYLEIRLIPEFQRNKKINGILVIIRDMTEHMKAQIALQQSENRYKRLIYNSPMAVLVHSNYKIEFVNPKAFQLFGAKGEDELIGKNIWPLIPPNLKEVSKERIDSIYNKTEYTSPIEQELLKLNGEKFYAEIISTPINYKGKSASQVLFSDITRRKLAEEKAHKSEEYLQSILKAAPVGIGVVVDQKVTYMNPRLVNMIGWEKEEIINKSIKQLLIDNKEFERIYEIIFNDLKKGEALGTIETQLVTKNKEVIEVLIHYIPIDSRDYKKGVTISLLDITERKHSEQSLLEKKSETDLLNKTLLSKHEEIKIINKRLQDSEEQLKKIINAVPHMIYAKTASGKFLFANEKVSDLYGLPACKLTGYLQQDLHPDKKEIQHYQRTDQKVLSQDGSVFISEEPFTDIGQRKHIVQTIKQPFQFSGLEEKSLLVVSVDITEQKQAQKKLMESEIRFKTYIESTSTGVFILNGRGAFVFFNTAFLNLIGHSRSSLIHIKAAQLIPADQKEHMESFLYILSKKKKVSDFDIILERKDGKKMNLLIDAIKLDRGQFLFFCKDITERKNFENELLMAKEKAEESDRLKTSFLANMSHEIRTPMNGILGFSALLAKNNLDQQTKERFITIINSNGSQLLGIINDIIDISKIEANQLKIINKKYNINILIDEVYGVFSNYIDVNAPKDLDINIFKGLSQDLSWVEGDSSRVKQVLISLMKNAYKFTLEGEIRFGYDLVDSSTIRFYVEDTGIGVTKEEVSFIFDSFRQGNEGNNRDFGGTGLGLAISKNLVEMMGGEIGVISHKGKGSEFFFTLPYRPVMSNKESRGSKKEKEEYDWTNKTILIAEDEKTNFMYLEAVLEETKVKIEWARNGEEAVKLFKEKHDIDLILMDIKMPGMGGFEAMRQIKEMDKEVPLVAQTAFAMAEDKVKCIDAGFDNYISKPIKERDLLGIIQRYFVQVERN